MYTFVTTNANGCDSTANLYLTINPSTTSTSNVTACDTYLWNGIVYTIGGVYTYQTTNSNGCDSLATLNLSIDICGCMDSLALNYNSLADTDDGSCNYCDISFNTPIYQDNSSNTTCDGFIIASASSSYLPITYTWSNGVNGANNLNLCTGIYTVTATDVYGCSVIDTFIIGQLIYGCLDSTASNYDPLANMNDSSCYNCDVSFIAPVIQDPSTGNCNGLVVVSAISSNSNNMSYLWNNGSTQNTLTNLCSGLYVVTATDGLGCNATDSIYVGTIIYGCTDSTQFNYNSSANIDDGSCIAIVYGCTDSTAFNYYAGANTDDGSCIASVYGCTDSTAFNYYAGANTDDGSCIAIVYGCTDSTQFNYNSSANIDDGSCLAIVYGCIDSTVFNYNSLANTDDGSCMYCDLSNTFLINNNSSSNCIGYVVATSSSSYSPISYLWSTGGTQNVIFGLCAGVYTVVITDAIGCSITQSVTVTETFQGCTDPTAINYDPLATIDNGTCTYSTVCLNSPITGLGVTNVIHDRVTLTFDNMNTYDALGAQICRVDQLRIKYREVGTSSWSQKNMAAPTGYDPTTGICNSTQNTDKLVLGLTGSTTYEWQMRVWYCATGATAWVVGPYFTTADNCPDVGNLSVTSGLIHKLPLLGMIQMELIALLDYKQK